MSGLIRYGIVYASFLGSMLAGASVVHVILQPDTVRVLNHKLECTFLIVPVCFVCRYCLNYLRVSRHKCCKIVNGATVNCQRAFLFPK